MPNFLFVEDEEGKQTLYNLDQIVSVSEIRAGHCLITFARGVVLAVTGAGADNLVAELISEARLVNGLSAAEMLKRRKSPLDSTPARIIPFDGSEPQS